MGTGFSAHKNENIFESELKKINKIVNNIVTDDDKYINPDYNFLSSDVCDKYTIIIESELKKHLKLELKKLGSMLYILPKNDDGTMKDTNITKKEICESLSNHYIKILIMLSLIKYIYNIKKNGDLSIAGTILKNIKINDNIFQIQFCGVPHKDYDIGTSEAISSDKLIGFQEGFRLFIEKVLTSEEAAQFINILQAILNNEDKKIIHNKICKSSNYKALGDLYNNRYKEGLKCQNLNNSKIKIKKGGTVANVTFTIKEYNPVFNNDLCPARSQIIRRISIKNKTGKDVYESYKTLRKNYNTNIKSIEKILDSLLVKDVKNNYTIRDIKNIDLLEIINKIKEKISIFYVQSLFDYQLILKKVLEIPDELLIA